MMLCITKIITQSCSQTAHQATVFLRVRQLIVDL